MPVAKSLARDIKAAVLKDVEGLTYEQIGERLGVSPPADFGYKGDYTAVRKMVSRGRTFLKAGPGAEGYASHVETLRAEAKRRSAMTEAERNAEDLTQAFGNH